MLNFRLVLLPIYILKAVIKQRDKLLTQEQYTQLQHAVTDCIKLDLIKVNSRQVKEH